MVAQTWDGIIRRSALPGGASRARSELADAARAGDWLTVFEVVHRHPHFVNASRPDGSSRFAPLHHAAYDGAPREIAARLVAAGAWRGLREAAGERPLDLARRRGHGHLLEFLEPRRLIDVPGDLLVVLQDEFHAHIRERMREFGIRHELRLPDLEVLLELERPEMWFPVPGMHGGFHFRLTTDEAGLRLVTDSWCRVAAGSEKHHEFSSPRRPTPNPSPARTDRGWSTQRAARADGGSVAPQASSEHRSPRASSDSSAP